ncbi:MAG: histone deacetylase, partial [Desulforhopalus sp.]
MARSLVELADRVCGGKILVCLEGGYNLVGLQSGVFTVLSELLGEQLETPFPSHLDSKTYQQLRNERDPHPAIERVREIAENYWKI